MNIVLLPLHDFPGKALSLKEQTEFLDGLRKYYKRYGWMAKILFLFFSILYNPQVKRLQKVEVTIALEKPDDETFKIFYIKYPDGTTLKQFCYIKL